MTLQKEETMLKAMRPMVMCAAALVMSLMMSTMAAAATPAKRLALLVGPTENNYIGSWVTHFTEDAHGAGFGVDVFTSPWNPALQAQQIDDAVAHKYDLILIESISQAAVVPALIRAKAAGVPVFMVISELGEKQFADLYVTYIGENSRRLGELAGQALGTAMSATGRTDTKVAAVVGSMAEGVAPARMEGFRAALAKYPDIHIVAVEDAKWDPALAERATGQLLARFAAQGGVDAIYGMNDVMANGVIQAASAAGVKLGTARGSLAVVGGNCMAVGIRNLKAGRMISTVLMVPADEAELATRRVKDFFDGKPLGKSNYIDHEIITQENVAKFARACSY